MRWLWAVIVVLAFVSLVIAATIGCALPRAWEPGTESDVFRSTELVPTERAVRSHGMSDRSRFGWWWLKCVPEDRAGSSTYGVVLQCRPLPTSVRDGDGTAFTTRRLSDEHAEVPLSRAYLQARREDGFSLSWDGEVRVDVPAFFVRGFLAKLDAVLAARRAGASE